MKQLDFFVEIINLIPVLSVLKIITTDIDFENKIEGILLERTEDDRSQNRIFITLSAQNKSKLLMAIDKYNLYDYIESIKITLNGKVLFKGYDGIEYGIISKDMHLSQQFIDNFINGDMCEVSKDF